MTVELNLKTVGSAIGIIVTIGALFLGAFEFIASKKHEPITKELIELNAQMEMLLEERLVKMERSDLYYRMTKSLGLPSDLENTSPDKFSDKSDYHSKQSSKK